jgi:hypothetical protein
MGSFSRNMLSELMLMAPRLLLASTRTWYRHDITLMLFYDVFHTSKDFHLAFGTNYSLASLASHPSPTWMFGVCNMVVQVPCRRDRSYLWSLLKWSDASFQLTTLIVRSNRLTKFAHHNLPLSVYRSGSKTVAIDENTNLKLYTDGVVRQEVLSDGGKLKRLHKRMWNWYKFYP